MKIVKYIETLNTGMNELKGDEILGTSDGVAIDRMKQGKMLFSYFQVLVRAVSE